MATQSRIPLTPDLSKAARRELMLTQSNVIAESGIQSYKLKQFEAKRYSLELSEANQLRDFYESLGVDLEQLAAHEATKRPPVDGETLAQRGLTYQSRPGFLIAEDIDQGRVDSVLERMEENEQRVSELIAQEHTTTLFGGVSDATDTAMRELFGRLAENHLLFRFLQGKTLIATPKDDPATIGDHLGHWAKDSPLYDVLTLSDDTANLDELEG
jgi:hypothetical protein